MSSVISQYSKNQIKTLPWYLYRRLQWTGLDPVQGLLWLSSLYSRRPWISSSYGLRCPTPGPFRPQKLVVAFTYNRVSCKGEKKDLQYCSRSWKGQPVRIESIMAQNRKPPPKAPFLPAKPLLLQREGHRSATSNWKKRKPGNSLSSRRPAACKYYYAVLLVSQLPAE